MRLARPTAPRFTVRFIPTLAAALLAGAVGCGGQEQPTAQRAADSTGRAAGAADDPFAGDTGGLASYVPPTAADSARRAQLFASITPEAVNAARGLVAGARDSTGPDVVRVQVLLDAAGFSPGVMDVHFPSTLRNQYDPSPTGSFSVTRVALDPDFHYNPKLYAEVPDGEEDALLPPGPNSPVGVVWIALSEPHYGIHGTPEPQTIGYASSHGCVRLTNWDARWLAEHVAEGTPVLFR
jgi:lipoprotein-anchoring transpeptidase ErfK/SrfK